MATTADIKKGMTLKFDDKLYKVLDFTHVKLARAGAFVRLKLKDITSGAVIEKTLNAGEEIEPVYIEYKDAQYLYKEDDIYHFMDMETYEQISIPKDLLEDAIPYLVENMEVQIMFAEGKPIGVKLPTFCILKVVETDPGVRGDTVSGGSKPAILETGLRVDVPLFIQVGDKIKVDTRTGKYVERVE